MAEAGPSPLAGTKKSKPFDVFGFLSRYLLLIVLLGNFGFTLLAPFALLAIKPYYEASAKLKISPVVLTPFGGSEETSILAQYRGYHRTEAMSLREESLLAEAIEQLKPEERQALFTPGLPTNVCASILKKRLDVEAISRSHYIELNLQSDRPKGLAPVLNAIMQVYKNRKMLEKERDNARRLVYLSTERENLEQEIREKTQKVQAIAKKTSTSSFSEAYNFYYKKAEQLQNAFIKVYLERINAEALYLQRLREKKDIIELSMESQVEELVANDWGLDSTQSWTYQQLQELRSGLYGLSSQNKDRQHILERMESMRKYEKQMTDEVRELSRKILYGKRNYELQVELIKAKNQFESLKSAEESIAEKLAKAKKEAAVNSELIIVGEELQAELRHMRELLFKYQSRINELNIQSKTSSRVSIASLAQSPRSPAGSNAKKLFMVALVLPFGFVTAFFLGIDYTDNRIRSPQNIVDALGHPSTWPVSRAPEGIVFHRVTLDAPECVTSKAIRSLAMRLYRETENHQSKVFLFNSVDSQSGTTGVLLNTAYHLGQMMPRILVIEGSFGRSQFRTWLGISEDIAGLGEVLRGEAKLDEALYRDDERNIDILCSSEDDIQIEASLIFQMVMAESRKNYDFILMDSSPLMKSDMTEYLSTHSDVVVLVVQGDRTLYKSLKFVTEMFVRLEIPALAAVLNWGGARYKTRLEQFAEKYDFFHFLYEHLSEKKHNLA